MTTNDKIFVQIGEEKVELLGAEKDAFLARVAEDLAKQEAEEAAKSAAAEAKTNLLTRLAITADEAKLLLS